MTLTKELLESKLAELHRQYQKCVADAEAIGGAMQLTQHLLGVLAAPEPQPGKPELVPATEGEPS